MEPIRSASRWLVASLVLPLTFVLALSGARPTVAQGQIAPVIGVHNGTCAQFMPEPAYDAGEMQLVPIRGFFEEGEGAAETVEEDEVVEPVAPVDPVAEEDDDFLGIAGDDGVFNQEDEGFLADDFDDDGVVEIGRDLDNDGILGEDEVLGDDVDNDGILTEDEFVVIVPVDPMTGLVWKADEEVDFDGEELVNQGPYVMVVHESAQAYGNYLACGEVLDLVEEDNVVVPLRPIGDSNYTGVALIEANDGEYAAYLFRGIKAPGQGARTPPTPTPPPPTPTPVPPTPTPMPPTPTPTPQPFDLPTEVAIELGNNEFNPSEFRVAPDTDVQVTLHNLSTTRANFTIDELGINETLEPDESRTITINAPAGQYTYYSNVPGQREAGMEGTLIVGQ
ncbi:MAG: cupredoxin domain-containing protein [Chloroflexota bacterium]|nr:cupredoxin domain-containing protein [Chloroflexota bacterium]